MNSSWATRNNKALLILNISLSHVILMKENSK